MPNSPNLGGSVTAGPCFRVSVRRLFSLGARYKCPSVVYRKVLKEERARVTLERLLRHPEYADKGKQHLPHHARCRQDAVHNTVCNIILSSMILGFLTFLTV